ncbi:MAG: TetR/AcrR family transcriptional regulator [Oscillospiraceae bacterium]|nr:TetR/AcrR family transcriptional regulator [Oscillospiraceae bacterium]
MENKNFHEFSPENLKIRRTEAAVTAAAELFLQYGIESVKMTDIAEKSGVGVATLYRYFGTKNQIVIEAMTYLWNEMGKLFSGVFESEIFLKQTGIKQMSDLLRMCLVLYEAHQDFLRVLGEFDLLILRENISPEKLTEYEKSVINFYPMFERAYRTGIADRTVRTVPDFRQFYLAYAHALLELGKKLVQRELLPSDDFSNGGKELSLLIECAVCYLRKE